MLELSDAEMVGRVALAVALGGLIGVEREVSGQPAGFRTHVALSLGAMLFGMISIHAFDPFTAETPESNVRIDVTRVASQVAVGVGFLGAGAILKEAGSIRGLTTAASLWTTAAIGLAVGVGWYAASVAVSAALLLSLVGLRSVRGIIRRRLAREEEEVRIRLVSGAELGGVVTALHELEGVSVVHIHVDQDPETRAPVITARVSGVPAIRLDALLAPLADRDDVDELFLVGRA